ncbi:MAG: outer membrane protein transport protein [Ignavibacteriales bacterium]|nr:outer membrane protein transport protein [Ignavibacteriales bacterium]
MNFISGSYTYNRNYSEADIYNKYSLSRFDTAYAFNTLDLINTIDGDISGFTAKIGLLYKFRNNSRVGFSVKLPSYYTIKETFATDGTSSFDIPDRNGVSSYHFIQDGRNEYDVASPFVFAGGLSIAIQDLMLSGDLEFTDWTQMEFRNADQQLLNLNTQIKELFQPTVNVRVGAEYEFNTIGLRLRGGFAFLPSPYNGDPASFAQKYITGGVGFIIENSIGIDVGYARGFRDSYRVNYNDFDVNGQPTSKTTESIKTNNVIATISYRF